MKYFLAITLALMLAAQQQMHAQGLNFDGSNDYVTINSVAPEFSGLTTFTVEFWMKADKNAQTNVRVGLFAVNKAVSAGDNVFIITMGGMNAQDGKLLIVDDVTGFDFVSTQVIGDNVCHHIAYVRDQSTARMYIDGTQAGTHVPDYTFSASNRFSLGHEWDNTTSSDQFEGTLEEVRLWNTARTATEISNAMHAELAGTEAGLIAYYPFNQGIPNGNNSGLTTLIDFSPNGNSGTLNNFALTGTISNWIPACNDEIEPNTIAEHTNSAINVYPNPAPEYIRIEGVFEKPQTITIVNAHGETVLNTTLSGTNPFMDVHHLSSGLYFIYGDGIRSRFIKQ